MPTPISLAIKAAFTPLARMACVRSMRLSLRCRISALYAWSVISFHLHAKDDHIAVTDFDALGLAKLAQVFCRKGWATKRRPFARTDGAAVGGFISGWDGAHAAPPCCERRLTSTRSSTTMAIATTTMEIRYDEILPDILG